MARYSKTPISFYLELELAELCEWMEVISDEIKAENDAINAARKGSTRHGQ